MSRPFKIWWEDEGEDSAQVMDSYLLPAAAARQIAKRLKPKHKRILNIVTDGYHDHYVFEITPVITYEVELKTTNDEPGYCPTKYIPF